MSLVPLPFLCYFCAGQIITQLLQAGASSEVFTNNDFLKLNFQGYDLLQKRFKAIGKLLKLLSVDKPKKFWQHGKRGRGRPAVAVRPFVVLPNLVFSLAFLQLYMVTNMPNMC